jgi:murein DD-endopeptidase MepM/ murein hydrolase activator NlpD
MSRFNARRDLRAPQKRSARAQSIAVRQPAPLLPHITLEDTLGMVGIRPRRPKGATHSHGLMWRWFALESTPLSIVNLIGGAALLVAAMTMTAPGMWLAVTLGVAPIVYRVLNDGLPFLALGLIAAALLKAAHAWLDSNAHVATRVLGYALALLMAIAALWIQVMLGYADTVPWLLKPALALAGGAATARIAAANALLVSYFEPALIGGAGLLLLAKQFKSGVKRRAPITRKRAALSGIALSLGIVAIAAHAGWRHYAGSDRRDGFSFAIGGETLSGDDRVFGSLFAPGVPCHVSSLYGWRDDPLEPGRNERHQGIDVAVKEGTPVHAMTDGRVMFAEFDGGLGNFVALQPAAAGAPTVVNGHMSQLTVHAGDTVHRGDVIGFAGSTGRSTGPHVHVQLCPAGHMSRGAFVCGGSTNPYENWPTLAALSRMACVSGPEIF